MTHFAKILMASVMIYCRVLAECDGGTARWKDLAVGEAGRPGKRGAPGPQGHKGEPGIGVNITDLNEKLQGNQGPTLYYYTNTITWDSGKAFCKIFEKTLCSFDQICIPKNGARELVNDLVPGDNWVPVLDEHNEWVEIGDHYDPPCFLHGHYLTWSKPGWGTSTETRPYKGYVYCCNVEPDTEAALPDVKYQYIGQSATYDSSLQHCESQGRRLCYSSEICVKGKPRFGVHSGDRWVAIKDRINDWIQIGNSNNAPSCTHHGTAFGLPGWGTRTDGSILGHVGYAFCCAKSFRK